MTKIYADKNISLQPLKDKIIGIIGYGNQGRAQALNLKNSGFNVCIGLRPKSASFKKVRQDGLRACFIKDAVQRSDIIMLLFPDEFHGEVFKKLIQPFLSSPKMIGLAHSYSYVFGEVKIPKNAGLFLVAPKGPGSEVRRKYMEKSGVAAAVNWNQPQVKSITLAYAKAIGCSRSCVFKTTFQEEVFSNLFSEQCVFPGGMIHMMKEGFDFLVKQGISREMAYFECFYKLDLLVDLLKKKGLGGLKGSISDIALYGSLSRQRKLKEKNPSLAMKEIYRAIKKGQFSKEWQKETKNGMKSFRGFLQQEKRHPLHRTFLKFKKLF